MKLNINNVPNDGRQHTYCLRCRREAVTEIRVAGYTSYHCGHCGAVLARALVFDPDTTWWLAPDGEYWHETAGVFVRNDHNQFLFLERAKHPFGLTIPAGHVGPGEPPLMAGRRELFEETRVRVTVDSIKFIVTEDVLGDECPRGSDAHRWHVFASRLFPGDVPVRVNTSESLRAVWLTLERALHANLTFAIRSLIARHGSQIMDATQ